jgi:hypothetical protein
MAFRQHRANAGEAELNAPWRAPGDTRVLTRALRLFGEHVDTIDWAYIRFSILQGRWWSSVARLSMPDPGGYGRDVVHGILGSCRDLDEFVEAVNGLAPQREPEPRAPRLLTAWGEAPATTRPSTGLENYGSSGLNR